MEFDPGTILFTSGGESGTTNSGPSGSRLASRYELITELGRGAMSVVYLAQDTRIGRKVAIKKCRQDESIGNTVGLHETRAAGNLVHPNIAAIYDVFDDVSSRGEEIAIVMEYVEGWPLSNEDQRVQIRSSLASIIESVAAGLDYAHAQSTVHRDVKPSNLLIRKDGTAKIIDFGIATIHSHDSFPDGCIVGTPPYMAPEVIMGGQATGSADQYGLATTVYWCFTGTLPYGSSDLTSMMFRKVNEDPPSMCARDTSLPAAVDKVVLRALSRNPDDRFRSCSEFAHALRAALKELPIQFYSCFISYSHRDKVFAQRLHDVLQRRGIRCWLDEHQVLPGDDLYEQVDRGIRLWDKVLLCCSQHSLTSVWVDGEIAAAFEKERRMQNSRGKRVLSLIPLNLDGYLFSGAWRTLKAPQIRQRLAADFRGWDSDVSIFDAQVEQVVRALRADEGSREAPPDPKL